MVREIDNKMEQYEGKTSKRERQCRNGCKMEKYKSGEKGGSAAEKDFENQRNLADSRDCRLHLWIYDAVGRHLVSLYANHIQYSGGLFYESLLCGGVYRYLEVYTALRKPELGHPVQRFFPGMGTETEKVAVVFGSDCR